MADVNGLYNVQVSAANTATPFTANLTSPTARVPANTMIIQAKSSNAASVFIGDSSVQSSTGAGIEVAAGASWSVNPEMEVNGLNLANWFFASTSAAAKLNILYLEG